MRVLIYAPAARMGGARVHVLGLVPELAALAAGDAGLLIAQPDLIAELPALSPSWTLHAEQAQRRGFLGRLLWEQQVLPRIARQWKADVLLSFGSFVPLRAPCPTVLEAGNALPFTRQYWHVMAEQPRALQAEEQARWVLLRASLRAAARVLTPTRAMRQDVVTSMPELVNRVDVAFWGVSPVFRERSWHAPADGEVVLGVSKHGINKEFDVLVRALARVRRRLGLKRTRLVLTGHPDESRWSRRTTAIAAQLGLDDAICFAGDVPNPSVPDLIQKARLLVFPTWCESFGLPLAEAIAMGAPAVAANIPACREVGADAARYYRAGDPDSLAESISALLYDPEQARALSQAARLRGQAFSWRENALAVRQTLFAAAEARP
jgi:alpha-1,3-rhamnosyl/mannosyltransferase